MTNESSRRCESRSGRAGDWLTAATTARITQEHCVWVVTRMLFSPAQNYITLFRPSVVEKCNNADNNDSNGQSWWVVCLRFYFNRFSCLGTGRGITISERKCNKLMKIRRAKQLNCWGGPSGDFFPRAVFSGKVLTLKFLCSTHCSLSALKEI